jgi:hypothetical protein
LRPAVLATNCCGVPAFSGNHDGGAMGVVRATKFTAALHALKLNQMSGLDVFHDGPM